MSPYGLRQSPKPSKRVREASEESNAPEPPTKRRNVPKTRTTVSSSAAYSETQTKVRGLINEALGENPEKRGSEESSARPAKKRKITTKKPKKSEDIPVDRDHLRDDAISEEQRLSRQPAKKRKSSTKKGPMPDRKDKAQLQAQRSKNEAPVEVLAERSSAKDVVKATEKSKVATRKPKKIALLPVRPQNVSEQQEHTANKDTPSKPAVEEPHEKTVKNDLPAKPPKRKRPRATSTKPKPSKRPRLAEDESRSQLTQQQPSPIFYIKPHTQPVSHQLTSPTTAAHLALDASIKAHLATHPKATPQVNIPLLHYIASHRGPQISPDGTGTEISPKTLPSPETPYTPYNGIGHPTTKQIQQTQKKIDRGRAVPSYWPFDIVSGGKPPGVSVEEEEFWDERVGRGMGWEEELCMDRYGRLWRCIKAVDVVGWREVRWDERGRGKGSGKRGKGRSVSPGTVPDIESMTEEEYEAFEREVESFLGVFDG